MATDVKNDANLSTGLVSYWEFEEASGTRVDSHGSNDLSDNNTVTQGTGIQGNCADLEFSNSEYFSITDADQSGLQPSGAISLSIWFNLETTPQSNGSNEYTFFRKLSAGSNRSYGFSLQEVSVGSFRFAGVIYGSAQNTFLQTISAPSTATWYHAVFTWNGATSEAKFYLNGSQVGTTQTGSQTFLKNDNSPVYIGGTAYFDGLLDEAGFWSKELSSTEVSDLYNGGSGIPYEAPAGAAFIPKVTMF